MNTAALANRYKNHRFPMEIISHAVWLYFRFCLSFRDVEELLFERGVVVTYEAIRNWCRKFGQQYANQLRRRRPRPGGQVASRRDGAHHQRCTSLFVAGGGSRRERARHLGAAPTQHAGGEEVLPQAAQRVNVRTARD